MPTSERRIAANRRNARKSTGPRSAAGKDRSAQNALKHGLTAGKALLADEDPQQFDLLREEMYREFKPELEIEIYHVERAAALIWRLHRIPAFEAALLGWAARESAGRFDLDFTYQGPEVSPLGGMLKFLLDKDMLAKLNRYESNLQKQLTLALKELRELVASRANESSAPEQRLINS